MRCHICDAALENPTYNRDLQQWEPCGTCLEIIFSVFEDAPEKEKNDDGPEDAAIDDEGNLARDYSLQEYRYGQVKDDTDTFLSEET